MDAAYLTKKLLFPIFLSFFRKLLFKFSVHYIEMPVSETSRFKAEYGR